MKYGQVIGVDFGTTNFIAYLKDKGSILCEPAVAAVERETGQVLAVGENARKRMRAYPERYDAAYPVSEGLIYDYKTASEMLGVFLRKLTQKKLLKPKVVVGIPIRAGEVARRAMVNAALDGGAVTAKALSEPFAAAAGIGLDLSSGKSAMIIDIGGGTTDISVISMGKVALGTSLSSAGKKMDRAVYRLVREEDSLEIGEKAAEQLKISGGTLTREKAPTTLHVYGRNVKTGLPDHGEITSDLILEALRPVADEIAAAAIRALDRSPREVVNEVVESGVYLTGGGSAIPGMDAYLGERIGISCHNVKNPLHSVAVGAGIWE